MITFAGSRVEEEAVGALELLTGLSEADGVTVKYLCFVSIINVFLQNMKLVISIFIAS